MLHVHSFTFPFAYLKCHTALTIRDMFSVLFGQATSVCTIDCFNVFCSVLIHTVFNAFWNINDWYHTKPLEKLVSLSIYKIQKKSVRKNR
jgi:hypothetical protein